ncbi:MAG: dephospho-CoA kinase [Phycisphaerae bacterium]|nr:dephospho-CoA kinase [Phycisphaerae bacterium]
MQGQSGSQQQSCLNVVNPSRKPIIGIIGGIASGKSTVATEFGKLGCGVISADALVHDLLAEEAVRDQVCELFGREILGPDGRIDRTKLARIVFADEQKLAALNRMIHPRVLQRTEELIARSSSRTDIKAIVLDMPLLVEVGWADRCDRLIFVKCDRVRRAERIRRTGRMNEQSLQARENFQISLDKKARLADNTIDNNSDFLTLVRQIQDIFSDIAGNR